MADGSARHSVSQAAYKADAMVQRYLRRQSVWHRLLRPPLPLLANPHESHLRAAQAAKLFIPSLLRSNPLPLKASRDAKTIICVTGTLFARNLRHRRSRCRWGGTRRTIVRTYLACRHSLVTPVQKKLPTLTLHLDFLFRLPKPWD